MIRTNILPEKSSKQQAYVTGSGPLGSWLSKQSELRKPPKMGRPWLTVPNLLWSQGLASCETACRLPLSLHRESWHPNGSRQVSSYFTSNNPSSKYKNTNNNKRHHFGGQVRNQVDGVQNERPKG